MDLKARRDQLVQGQQQRLSRLQELQTEARRLETEVQQFVGALAIIDEQLVAAGGTPGDKKTTEPPAPLSRAQRRRLAKGNAHAGA